MAANKQQGQWFGLFLAGMTATCAGLAWISEGLGKVSLVLGLILLAVSLREIYRDQEAGRSGSHWARNPQLRNCLGWP